MIHTFPLTCLRLRFHCEADTPLHLGGLQAGSNLRGALVEVMRRATCAGDPSDPAHMAVCPVCWLVAAQEHPGQERRGYTLAPPLLKDFALRPGETFSFHITLFSSAMRYLPYFVLALPEVGRAGVGPGRGRFTLKSIVAESPQGLEHHVLAEGENVVRLPAAAISHPELVQSAAVIAGRIDPTQPRLGIHYLTPLRLVVDGRLLKSPDFGVLFARLLERLDDLAIQYAEGERRSPDELQRLWGLANRVRLVESQAAWADIPSGSSRSGQRTWISGLIGLAWYSAPVEIWPELLPWLLWGEIAQVGKDTAKGNGVFRISL